MDYFCNFRSTGGPVPRPNTKSSKGRTRWVGFRAYALCGRHAIAARQALPNLPSGLPLTSFIGFGKLATASFPPDMQRSPEAIHPRRDQLRSGAYYDLVASMEGSMSNVVYVSKS